MFSFDTEALNKCILGEDNNEHEFMNQFQATSDQKHIYGVQQLYTIGTLLHITCAKDMYLYVFNCFRCF